MTSRRLVFLAAVGCLGSVVIAATPAAASTTKGSPQPELKPFTLAPKDDGGGGSVAILPSGTLLAAFTLPTADDRGKTEVCILPRAGRACSSRSPVITPPAGASNDVAGVPQVLAPGGAAVDLLISYSTSGTLLYRSTNSGDTFGTPVSLGTSFSASAAEVVAGNLVFTPSSDSDGSAAESVPLAAPVAPGGTALPSDKYALTIGLGTAKKGVLVADGDDDGSVVVSFAAAGKDFDATSSYSTVATFPNESLEGLSGSALLTEAASGAYRLRLFNGSTFGAAHTVPHGDSPGPDNQMVSQDPSGETHIFSVRAADGYDLAEQSTKTGATWTTRQLLSNATASSTFGIGLDATGSGIVLGTNASSTSSPKVTAYPVLARQAVSFALSKAKVTKGHEFKASGRVTAAKKGRRVTLERLEKGLWHSVATTKESASGAFTFTLTDATVGTFSYRAVAADSAGFVQFGYSSARSEKVEK